MHLGYIVLFEAVFVANIYHVIHCMLLSSMQFAFVNFLFYLLILIQVYDDTTEGKKVCTYYRLDSIPVVLIIDPITGQKMRAWGGMVQPDSLLEVCIQLHSLL